MHVATGTFDIQVTPLAPKDADARTGHLTFTKVFQGQIEGTSTGDMLAVGTAASDAGAYVAIEWITGKLDGKEGSFALHHNGTKQNGGAYMDINVVPGSGNGQLMGISGKFEIQFEGKQHHYRFEYSLPEASN
ncbi:MAG: DUF3224 domain-containing protein [Burkholderiales bacterium]|nr:DUF3224 domain-containing protein [Burkholderiales bacterium]